MMYVKFNKIILLCIIMLFCALNTIEAQTKYYTYQNNFGVLNKHKLSIKNIKKSFKDYAIYFTTLILGVCIFYVFNSIDSQTAMLNITQNQSDMIELLTQVLSYLSIFVSFILGFLIIYASRFLIKRRNRQFNSIIGELCTSILIMNTTRHKTKKEREDTNNTINQLKQDIHSSQRQIKHYPG